MRASDRQHRRGETDRAHRTGISAMPTDGHAHQREAQHHRGLAAGAIGIGADDDAAERAAWRSPRRRSPARPSGWHRRCRREEGVADLDGEEGVGDEVVEFERIADASAAAIWRRFNCAGAAAPASCAMVQRCTTPLAGGPGTLDGGLRRICLPADPSGSASVHGPRQPRPAPRVPARILRPRGDRPPSSPHR